MCLTSRKIHIYYNKKYVADLFTNFILSFRKIRLKILIATLLIHLTLRYQLHHQKKEYTGEHLVNAGTFITEDIQRETDSLQIMTCNMLVFIIRITMKRSTPTHFLRLRRQITEDTQRNTESLQITIYDMLVFIISTIELLWSPVR